MRRRHGPRVGTPAWRAGELEVCLERVERCGAWFTALEWGEPTGDVSLAETMGWWLGVVAGLMNDAQYMSDAGFNGRTAGDLVDNAECAKRVAVGAEILEQLHTYSLPERSTVVGQ